MKTLEILGNTLAVILYFLMWLLYLAIGLAVPALAIWALLHFAFHVI